ncbi:hypothetical protein C4580_04385 [Candidatus Woesearchaeota archaeon]|nr:MAG: hypothetical protein C4580_04385 [Candidatus Woesearchaeota archaeon]
MNPQDIADAQRELVLARFKTLNSKSKLMLGGGKELSVGELIKHVENNDELGKRIVSVQMKMLKILTE